MSRLARTASAWLTAALVLAAIAAFEATGLTQISYVIDGDTVKLVSGERARFEAIDAPELRGHWPFELGLAAKAKQRLEALLAAGSVRVLRIGRHDQYGRPLVRVMAGGVDSGAVLVAEGLARPYDGRHRETWCYGPPTPPG